MKFFAFFVVLVLALALAGPFFLRGPDGKPLMQTSDLEAGIGSATGRLLAAWGSLNRSVARLRGDDGKVTVYSWQDEDGRWHYSDEAPPGQTVQTLSVDPNANRMAAPPPPPPPPAQPGNAAKTHEINPPIPSPLSVPPEAVGDLIDDTHAVRGQLEARDRDIEAASRPQ